MKKLNKLVAILVAMAMVLSLGVVSAFAEANPNTATQSITISKKLTMAQGLTAPVDFTFATTPV
ncbi:MAG: hypothetical protein IIY38_06805, partial [Clostridia bacterium]|nr:hypothetical protein [Clostridia bacterium]